MRKYRNHFNTGFPLKSLLSGVNKTTFASISAIMDLKQFTRLYNVINIISYLRIIYYVCSPKKQENEPGRNEQ